MLYIYLYGTQYVSSVLKATTSLQVYLGLLCIFTGSGYVLDNYTSSSQGCNIRIVQSLV